MSIRTRRGYSQCISVSILSETLMEDEVRLFVNMCFLPASEFVAIYTVR